MADFLVKNSLSGCIIFVSRIIATSSWPRQLTIIQASNLLKRRYISEATQQISLKFVAVILSDCTIRELCASVIYYKAVMFTRYSNRAFIHKFLKCTLVHNASIIQVGKVMKNQVKFMKLNSLFFSITDHHSGLQLAPYT